MNEGAYKRDVARHYDVVSKLYDKLYLSEQLKKVALILSSRDLSQDLKVLDVGCGTGLLLERIVGAGCLSIGLDLSLKMLEKAKCKVGEKRCF